MRWCSIPTRRRRGSAAVQHSFKALLRVCGDAACPEDASGSLTWCSTPGRLSDQSVFHSRGHSLSLRLHRVPLSLANAICQVSAAVPRCSHNVP
eukprot:159751-Chlamydomonas_euryale.AAC.1